MRAATKGASTAASRPAAPLPKVEPGRIAKLLARAGVASRRDIERMIGDGRVKYRGTVLTSPAFVLDSLDGVLVDDKPVASLEPVRLFRFHKPRGCVTSNGDPDGRRTIFDVLPKGLPRLVTVGRLDFNTEGLLLLTNDGGLARHLELPTSGYVRQYRVRVFGAPDPSVLADLQQGVTIDRVHYGPIAARIVSQGASNAWLAFALTEGKNREVRRICAHLGFSVSRLMRVAYGPFILGELPEGAVEEMTAQDVARLLPAPYGRNKRADVPDIVVPDKKTRRTAAERKATSFKQLQREGRASAATTKPESKTVRKSAAKPEIGKPGRRPKPRAR